MGDPSRVRVVFEDYHVLTKSQRSMGMRRCWVLLNPDLATIGDLASHLTHTFALRTSCPDDLILSMDGFVLPSFESTCIFKDKDIIRVRRKGRSMKEVMEIGDDGHHLEDSEILENQPICLRNKLLAIMKFKKDSVVHKSKAEGHEHVIYEDTVPTENHLRETSISKRNREHSDMLRGSKRKKLKLCPAEKQDITTEDAENDHVEHDQNSQKVETVLKILSKKHMLSNKDDISNASVVSQGDDVENTPCSVPREIRRKKLKVSSPEKQDITAEDAGHDNLKHDQSPKNRGSSHNSLSKKDMPSNRDDRSNVLIVSQVDDVENTPSVPGEKRRKKTKPTSLEERDGKAKDAEDNYTDRRVASLKCPNKKDRPSKGDDKLDALVVSLADDSIENPPKSVPKERRPDQDEVNACKPNSDDPKEKLPSRSSRRKKAKRQWRREMEKSLIEEHTQRHARADDIHREAPEHREKDQNGVMEDEITPIIVRPGHIRFGPIDDEESKQQANGQVETLQWNGITSKKKGQKWGQEKTSSRSADNSCYEDTDVNGKFTARDGNLLDAHVDFESLPLFSSLPKEGDVIAYRIVELTSSWCPELSSFRVGKVASYDSISMKVILRPVPKYPIVPVEVEEDTDKWQPDLSLYKEDGSLEVIFQSLHDVRIVKVNSSQEIAIDTRHKERTEEAAPTSNCEVSSGNDSEKRQNCAWEQINQALSEKKVELQKNGGWGNWKENKDTTTTPWSYRVLRRSAVGPTMAWLRARNGDLA